MNQRKADEIIDAVLERVEIVGEHNGDAYPSLPISDRTELVNIIIDIVKE